MVQTPLTDNALPRLGDLLKYELAVEYNRDVLAYHNTTGGPVTVPLGMPISSAGVLIVAATVANTYGVVLGRFVVPDGATVRLPVLARGPAVLDAAQLPAADLAAASYVGLAAKLLTLGIVCRAEPTVVGEQLT